METSFSKRLYSYLVNNTKAAPLAVFRVLFGLLMLIASVRFSYHGWIEKLYVNPSFHFHYSGFDFIGGHDSFVYILFIICGISAAMVSLGFKYRMAIILFFLSFTWIELLDKTTYLNHYYFISILSFILIFLPANCTFSIDAYRNKNIRAAHIPSWQIDIIKLMLAIVYIYAGLAKLNYDWLINAMPLSIWLPSKFDIPLLGEIMHKRFAHYIFSWGGALYDIFIVFFLLYKPTRLLAFFAVVIFHVLTRVLFPIGMFPYIMIASSLIFFSPSFHEKIVSSITSLLRADPMVFQNASQLQKGKWHNISVWVLGLFIVFQLLFPLRHFAYPGNVYWTEQGYRFSWRVMLMEKTGYANFKIVDAVSGKRFYVQNDDFLTSFQEKQMSTQPDFILQYGQYLGRHFQHQGHQNVEVYVESHVALNGRASQPFVDPNVDLMKITYKELCRDYLAAFNE